jgi:hypothetical protein
VAIRENGMINLYYKGYDGSGEDLVRTDLSEGELSAIFKFLKSNYVVVKVK